MNPPRKKKIPSSPQEWLVHAESDLKLAKLGLNKDVLPEQICFHAQQTVEKTLKAVLLFYKIDFPFTHDLEELLDTFEAAKISVPAHLLDVGILTPYAVETRYPGFWGEILESEVSEAILLAEKAIKWAEEVIKKK
jgi:HEPN domain-containing protein